MQGFGTSTDKNMAIFSTQTTQNTKIPLFEKLTQYVTDDAARASFARALVDNLVNFSFEEAFEQHYDFFAYIFEYLIKDYNTAGGGKHQYAGKCVCKHRNKCICAVL